MKLYKLREFYKVRRISGNPQSSVGYFTYGITIPSHLSKISIS